MCSSTLKQKTDVYLNVESLRNVADLYFNVGIKAYSMLQALLSRGGRARTSVMYMYMCVYIHIYTHVYVCVCIYIYIYIHSWPLRSLFGPSKTRMNEPAVFAKYVLESIVLEIIANLVYHECSNFI